MPDVERVEIPESDWKTAEDYFADNPDATKLSKYEDKLLPKSQRTKKLSCSFIKSKDADGIERIYAIQDGNVLGEGAHGKVKLAQSKEGNLFAVKIQRKNKASVENENKILELVGELVGYIYRSEKFKNYQVLPLYKGGDLFCNMTKTEDATGKKSLRHLPMPIKLILGIRAAEAIKSSHSVGLIHCDIKPENLMLNFNLEGIKLSDAVYLDVFLIDYGFAKKLENGEQNVVVEVLHGTEGYIAPEINQGYQYSKASDMYALGIIFRDFLQLDVASGLTDDDPDRRLNVDALITSLYEKLKEYTQTPLANKNIKKMVDDYYQNQMTLKEKTQSNQFSLDTSRSRSVETPTSEVDKTDGAPENKPSEEKPKKRAIYGIRSSLPSDDNTYVKTNDDKDKPKPPSRIKKN